MKFFTKLFLCITLVLTAALASAEYFTLSTTFRSTMNHQAQEALQQHQLVKYALQADLLTAQGQGTLSQDGLQDLADQGERPCRCPWSWRRFPLTRNPN
jgi:hypothetical protein